MSADEPKWTPITQLDIDNVRRVCEGIVRSIPQPDPYFATLADKLVEQAKAANITDQMEVVLIYDLADENGTLVSAARNPLAPLIQVTIPGNREAAAHLAGALYQDAVIRSIDSLVRHAIRGPFVWPDSWGIATPPVGNTHVFIQGFRLEIHEPLKQ